MDVEAITHHVGRLLDVVAPVAALLGGVDKVDAHHALLLAITVDEVGGHPHFSGIDGAGDEVLDVLNLLLHALALFQRVVNLLIGEKGVPIVAVDFDLVFDRCGIADFGLLSLADEFLQVVPVAAEDGRVVGRRVIALPRRGEAHDHGELAGRGADFSQPVGTGRTAHQHLEVAEGIFLVEQCDHLDILAREVAVALFPVGIEDVIDAALLVGFLEATVTGILVPHLNNLSALLIEDDDGHRKEIIFHVGALLEEELSHGVHKHEPLNFGVLGRGLGLAVYILEAGAIGGEDVEEKVLAHHLVRADFTHDVKRQLIVIAEGHVKELGIAGDLGALDASAVLVENICRVADVGDGVGVGHHDVEDFSGEGGCGFWIICRLHIR